MHTVPSSFTEHYLPMGQSWTDMTGNAKRKVTELEESLLDNKTGRSITR